jgi:hypothetical protein
MGHVQGLLVDEQTWAIRYLIVQTSAWWLGHQVLIAPQWIRDMSWLDSYGVGQDSLGRPLKTLRRTTLQLPLDPRPGDRSSTNITDRTRLLGGRSETRESAISCRCACLARGWAAADRRYAAARVTPGPTAFRRREQFIQRCVAKQRSLLAKNSLDLSEGESK